MRPHPLHFRHARGFELIPDRTGAIGTAIERVVHEIGECLTPESARSIAALRADPDLQERIESLAERNAAGTITPEEREELEGYLSATTFLSILQAEARRTLRDSGTA